MANAIKTFGNLCTKTQKELKRYLYGVLTGVGYKPIVGDGFIYAEGATPILLTAHMDTVHKVQVKKYITYKKGEQTIITAKDGIGGDDRCGIYMILQTIKDGYRPSILFCEDEEIGGVGSRKFCESKYIDDLKEMKYLIELDRMNGKDAVFYDCDNKEFTQFILEYTGYEENWGSFSDISHLSPACGVASVNLSCGYYNPHTTKEYVVFEEMENTIKVVEKLLEIVCEKFEYVERLNYYGAGYYYGYYDDNDFYSYYSNGNQYITKSCNKYLEVTYYDSHGKEQIGYGVGSSENECIVDFFMSNPNVCWNDVVDYDFY